MPGELTVLDMSSGDPCRGCGACCLHLTYPPFYRINEAQWEKVVAERPDLVAEIEADYERRYAPGGSGDAAAPCLWLDRQTMRCRNYEHRPEVCMDFEVGAPECLDMRERAS